MFEGMIEQNGIRVEKHLDPRLPPLSLDAVLMGQVFQNVIHNAIQAMPNGGVLSLICCFNHQRPGYASISISDTGKGIKASELNKIFHPLYTTKDSGIGLGLSLAYRIIEAHEGIIQVCHNPCPHLPSMVHGDISGSHNFPSKGVTIHIHLPRDAAGSGQSRVIIGDDENEPSNTCR
jgi:signal transduction histidine kinase